ncbi:MAG: hypothetical protein KU37_03680 [Sulfuricurvum sp. PC08-66]|nr:MAG: hypothetical protein KU37_03680 [Sulfuricurvum sp. PC08-66]
MNSLRATVDAVRTVDALSIVYASHSTMKLQSMLLDVDPTVRIGASVELLFKENEVLLASIDSRLSARNAFVGRIVDAHIGILLASVTITAGDTTITSIVTRDAWEYLDLAIDQEVQWCIKSNEVSLRLC